jgi:hypothetical protein
MLAVIIAWLGLVTIVFVQAGNNLGAETLICSTWQQITTRSSPSGYRRAYALRRPEA